MRCQHNQLFPCHCGRHTYVNKTLQPKFLIINNFMVQRFIKCFLFLSSQRQTELKFVLLCKSVFI